MSRYLVVASVAMLSVALVWYLFIRPFDYHVRFRIGTTPGDVIQTLRIWNRSIGGDILEVDSTNFVRQKIRNDSSDYIVHWRFRRVNDSITQVHVEFSEPVSSVKNRIMIPFKLTPIEHYANKLSREFYAVLKEHLKITKVAIVGEAEISSTFCVCRSQSREQIDKALGMMQDYPLLTALIEEFRMEVTGVPFVEVTDWNQIKGTLSFNFCFPVRPPQREYLDVEGVFFKTVEKQRALKAEYWGNYITSDRAWYALIAYAKKSSYKIAGYPVEYFIDNPTLGWQEQKWKAEIMLPIE